MKRVAVIGGGISGIAAAYELAKAGVNVVLYEKEDGLGGHAKTVHVNSLPLHLDFMLFNRVTFPHMTELFDNLGIDIEASSISFSMSLNKGLEYEWGSQHGLTRSLFAHKRNLVKPQFWKLLREINKFKDDVIMYLEKWETEQDMDCVDTLGHFIQSRGYSEFFQKAYLVPLCASIWCCSPNRVMDFSALSVLSFMRTYYLFQLSDHPQWLTVRGGSHHFLEKLREELQTKGCQIKTNCEVHSVSTCDKGCMLSCGNGSQDVYDECIMAISAPDAIRILEKEATHDEIRILGAFQYTYSDAFLHHDKSFMPQNPMAWSAWNFQESTDGTTHLTYWLNAVQNLGEKSLPYFMTLNPSHPPKDVLLKWSAGNRVPSIAAKRACLELEALQGKRGIWFTEAYHGNGSYEDGWKAGIITAHALCGKSFTLKRTPKQMEFSWIEAAVRHYVIRFLRNFVSAGYLILLEDGGAVFTFEGSDKRCKWKSTLRVHNPKFYWKVATEADLGLADSFVNGDISVVDKNEGLMNFFMILIANLQLYPNASEVEKKRHGGWWPLLITASTAYLRYFYQRLSMRNTISQARSNVARHYDLSNEMFALFLDDTMQYSCAIFKSENEDLKVAQLRKTHVLIDKARVEKHHELLEIGCGWGTLAIEAVKKTGCRYTGITLSEEQLKYAEQKAKEAGLQGRIRFLLCDYRELPSTQKYDRIISCGMLEHVGDEYYEEFFRQCDAVLDDNGVLVVQTIAIPDERYAAHVKSSDFMREYIFPGGSLPSYSRITSAMVAASRLCVEHTENIGQHYYQTLRCWRKNFLDNHSKIRALGFDEKFLKVWEYYFDYCASGFFTRTLLDYQIVFSRQGNIVAFPDYYKSIPSAYNSYP